MRRNFLSASRASIMKTKFLFLSFIPHIDSENNIEYYFPVNQADAGRLICVKLRRLLHALKNYS